MSLPYDLYVSLFLESLILDLSLLSNDLYDYGMAYVANEEWEVERQVVRTIISGNTASLQPNSGQPITIRGHNIIIGCHDERGSNHRVWEWHGHVMMYEEMNGYSLESLFYLLDPMVGPFDEVSKVDSGPKYILIPTKPNKAITEYSIRLGPRAGLKSQFNCLIGERDGDIYVPFCVLRVLKEAHLKIPKPPKALGSKMSLPYDLYVSLFLESLVLDLSNDLHDSGMAYVANEEWEVERQVIHSIISGNTASLQPNSHQSITIRGHNITVGCHDERGSNHRVWEWHGHVMTYDEKIPKPPKALGSKMSLPYDLYVSLFLESLILDLSLLANDLYDSGMAYVANEEWEVERRVVRTIIPGNTASLQPNSGQPITIRGHNIIVRCHDERGSNHRVWEWHGHVMMYEEMNVTGGKLDLPSQLQNKQSTGDWWPVQEIGLGPLELPLEEIKPIALPR
ncbi:hypothetical protein CKAN_02599000 [Cinnamomum micranthum f. kanehirae]|uniref:Uncharacterized protein n=1 Tax=Cinnamomum micranthum f. kanehirae TaxID=337451 RepID=A0A443Q0S2_9MAGN|nr:hypothetical protein CKAN_02599000 [Cinnamomum micranthum f. kanehirae]